MLRGALSPHYGDSILEVKYGQDDDDFELIEKGTDGIEKLSSLEIEEVTTSLSNPSVDPKDTSLPETHHFPQIIQSPHKIPSLFAAAKRTVYLLMGPKTIQRNPTSVIVIFNTWVTMLVVRFLEEMMPEEEDVWGLVVEKAREYVRECLETGELQLLEEIAGLSSGKEKLKVSY